MAKLKPIHPGEILREEFMRPLGLNANKMSLALRVPAPGIYQIIKEERAISPEMALRFGRYFNTSAEFWQNLQAHYDLQIVRQKDQSKITREIQPLVAVAG